MKIKNAIFATLLSTSMVVLSTFSIASAASKPVTLRIESWRAEDTAFWNKSVIPVFKKLYPNINIIFAPTNANEYDSALNLRMQGRTAGDIIMCRPYGSTKTFIKNKNLVPLTGLPGLQNFTKQALESWSSRAGVPYCVPAASVGAGFYYNKDIFKELKVTPPTTQAQFIAMLEKVKKNGRYTPIVAAGNSGDAWALDQMGLEMIGPNYYQGDVGSKALDDGKMKATDPKFVAALSALASWKPYLPKAFSTISYNDAEQLFTLGKVAVLAEGSWSINQVALPGMNVGVFGPPVAKAGDKPYVQVLADHGFGLNSASPSQAAGKLFLSWLAGKDFAQAYANALPGFFPLINQKITVSNPMARAWLNLRNGAILTAPIGLDKMNEGTPNWPSVINNLLNVMMTTNKTSKATAVALQKSLESWYPPQMKNRK
jgi:raffinose/stachyose/melibiose transport system substrate-binding protein